MFEANSVVEEILNGKSVREAMNPGVIDTDIAKVVYFDLERLKIVKKFDWDNVLHNLEGKTMVWEFPSEYLVPADYAEKHEGSVPDFSLTISWHADKKYFNVSLTHMGEVVISEENILSIKLFVTLRRVKKYMEKFGC